MSTRCRNRGPLSLWLLLMLGVLSAVGVAAFYLAGRSGRAERPLSKEQLGLVKALEESASPASDRATPIRVAVFAVQGRESNPQTTLTAALESGPPCTWEVVGPADVQAGALKPFEVVVFPGGSGSQMAAALGDAGKEAVCQFVESGGGYVGICGGAFLATARYDWSLALVNAKTVTGERNIPGLGMRSMAARGAGTVKMELTEAGRRVFGDFPGLLDVPYTSGPVLSPAGRRDLPEYVPLALYRTEIWEYKPQRGTMIHTPAIVAARFAKGRVMIFSPHPEMTEDLESFIPRAVLATAPTPVDASKTPEAREPAANDNDLECRAVLGSASLCLR
jgi:putative intracellular protease/amidase